MTTQIRTQLSVVNRENGVPTKNTKVVQNGIGQGQLTTKVGLSARNTNVDVHSNVVEAPRKPVPVEQAVVGARQPAPKTSIVLEKTVLPANIVDIDEYDGNHLEFSAVYVKDIYQYLFKLETRSPVDPQYLQKHPTLKAHMRMILIEWLVSLQARFRLLQETLFLTVSTMDQYMSQVTEEVSRGKFQLVGVTCLLAACKYEEMYLPSIADLAYMCDGAYTADDIIAMERKILATLQFDFSKPLSAHFLRRFSKAGGADSLTHTIAKYFLELALYDYGLVHCNPSAIAAGSLYIAGRITEVVDWDETVQFYSGYKVGDLHYVISRLAEAGVLANSNKYFKTTYKKYAADKFRSVAKLVVHSDVVRALGQQQQQQQQQEKR